MNILSDGLWETPGWAAASAILWGRLGLLSRYTQCNCLKKKRKSLAFEVEQFRPTLRYNKTFSLDKTAKSKRSQNLTLLWRQFAVTMDCRRVKLFPTPSINPHMNTRYNGRGLAGLILHVLCIQLWSPPYHMNLDITRTTDLGIKLNKYPPDPRPLQVLAPKERGWRLKH